MLNCGIASLLSVLATFTATIVALNWTEFNASVLTETDARHFYFKWRDTIRYSGKKALQCSNKLHGSFRTTP